MSMGRLEKLLVNSQGRQRSRMVQARRLLGMVPLEGTRDYLEVGCGTGAVTRFVAGELGLRAIGIDIDPGQIAAARDGAGKAAGEVAGARFEVGDAARLPFEDGSFDIVLSFMATHHTGDPDAALGEVARVLRPGGHFVYADILLPAAVARVGRVLGHGYRLPRSEGLLAALAAAGFATVWASRTGERFYGKYEAVLRRDSDQQMTQMRTDRLD
jgi:ubiquinone/menaquinone biosynthesis C-methylase UbiE